MHDLTARQENLPVETGPLGESRLGDVGGYTVDFGSRPAGVKMNAATYHGLPGDACPCPHWGFLLSGHWRISLAHGDIVEVHAGDAYYLPAGHHLEVVVDSEYVEFSPHELHRQTREALRRNAFANRS